EKDEIIAHDPYGRGVSERRWRSAANRPSRQARRGWAPQSFPGRREGGRHAPDRLRFLGKNDRMVAVLDFARKRGASMAAPLADRVRPTSLDEVVGQKHILGPGRALRRILQSGKIPNMVFYGPAGVGKTTVASLIAKTTDRCLVKLNGTTASTADIKEAVARTHTFEGLHGVLLYLDEIQYFNKKQQQTLL